LVVEVLSEPGVYGGTLRNTAPGPGALSDIHTAMVPGLFRFSADLSEQLPELATSHEFSTDYRTCVIHLREGVKWSDGKPFTADDVLFYFEDWQFDEEISPVTSSWWLPGGERMSVTKQDRYSVEFRFAVPNPAFALVQYSSPPIVAYAPAHFLRQFHPKHNDKAVAEARDNGFENWIDQFLTYAVWGGLQPPERPDLAPWVPVGDDGQRQRYERNPYYWKVDAAGRQLPYIDEVITDFVEDMDVTQLKVQAGDVSFGGLNLVLENYPVLKRAEEKGGYRAALAANENGSDVALAFNQRHRDPVLREIFADVRFRRAVSVALNREEINRVVFLRQGTPRQATINESATFFDERWANAYADYDPDLANQLLDELGLDTRQGDTRLRPDGKPLNFNIEYSPIEGPKLQVVQLVVQHLRAVGLGATENTRGDTYMNVLMETDKFDAVAWQANRSLERALWAQATTSNKFLPGGNDLLTYAVEWRKWFESDGAEGAEPPAVAKELQDLLEEWQRHDVGTDEYTATATRIFDIVADQLWLIGTVGQGPNPVVVASELENVFDESVFSGETRPWWGAAPWFWHPHRAEQWFFKNA
jgi:peptide/nickel transport system substrate-binding protein